MMEKVTVENQIEEELPEELNENNLISQAEAIRLLHFPSSFRIEKAEEKMKYVEILDQLSLKYIQRCDTVNQMECYTI